MVGECILCYSVVTDRGSERRVAENHVLIVHAYIQCYLTAEIVYI